VLDLDETLIHYFEAENYFVMRPYCEDFIQKLSEKYEIIVFTAATKDYAETVVQKIDPERLYVKSVLSRAHTQKVENKNEESDDKCLKNLEDLGRDLSQVIIVDNLKENFAL